MHKIFIKLLKKIKFDLLSSCNVYPRAVWCVRPCQHLLCMIHMMYVMMSIITTNMQQHIHVM